jgi:predicted TIM-barrel fold metal-dependent hydrolase
MSSPTNGRSTKVSIVSADGHAVMPVERWPEYLERDYHDYLPQLLAENEVNARAMYPLNDLMMAANLDVLDTDGAYSADGWTGAWDPAVRLAQMDREGIAAEVVYHGFFRITDLAFSVMNDTYPAEVVDAGVRAYDRWSHDTFGAHSDRLLLVGAIGACLDLDSTMAEAAWVADHGFIGTYAPGFLEVPGQPPLDDKYWDPLWALYADRGLKVIVHGGYGLTQGLAYGAIADALTEVEARGGDTMDLVAALASGIFSDKFFDHLGHRRALWQLLLGGVFDRHPGLEVLMTEVRADWIPATIRHLDAVFDEHRGELPTSRRPSEWWGSNCMVGASFMHKSEIEMRDEIGVDRLMFGRDYPHAEGTWPNTRAFLADLFAGVPDSEVRTILGENAIGFFGLDGEALAAVAERIGPTVAELTAAPAIDPALVQHLGDRCGYLKPAEGDRRIGDLGELLDEDLDRLASTARS